MGDGPIVVDSSDRQRLGAAKPIRTLRMDYQQLSHRLAHVSLTDLSVVRRRLRFVTQRISPATTTWRRFGDYMILKVQCPAAKGSAQLSNWPNSR